MAILRKHTHWNLVATDELVGEGEARHDAALLEPEDSREGAREENTLHSGVCNQPLGK